MTEYISNLSVEVWISIFSFIILMVAACILSVKCSENRVNANSNRFVALLLLLPMVGVVLISVFAGPDKCRIISRTSGLQALIRGLHQGFKETKAFRNIALSPQLPDNIHCKHFPQDIYGVIVIGESATRSRLSIYGHDKETTPCLLKNKQDLIVFSNAICRETYTVGAINSIFLLKSSKQNNILCYAPAIHKKAGFTQSLFSMQESWSKSDSTKYVFHCLDKKHYMTEKKYDEFLIPPIQPDSSSGNGMIVYLHLSGSHVPFSDRFPDGKRFFSKNILQDPVTHHLAEYDDTIRYTDECLGKIIDKLKQRDRPAFMLYFSDHGESVYNGMSEAATHIIRDPKSSEMFEVPLILWANDAFRASYPDIWKYGKANADKAFCTDSLAWSIFSLCGISFDGFEEEKDLFSEKYQSQEKHPGVQRWYELKHPITQ